ncbi:hypothetical protein C8Q77DRAFT_1217614 [Trametes polyzona]|nr:hypothetical protein C8Q77DRAFT_1217614 [Trametes polyzona]
MVEPSQLRIACRMVCTDQWLVTHVDPAWPVSQLKSFLLHKFARERSNEDKNKRSIPVSPRKTRRRSLSPITFATPPRKPRPVPIARSSSGASAEGSDPEAQGAGSEGEDEDDDEEVVDVNKALADAHRYKYNTRPSTSSASDTPTWAPSADEVDATQEADSCVLITFSTTQILEDRFSLEWYGIHPDELLELHPQSYSFVSLPRSSLDAYIAPYFAAKVWALRVVGNTLDTALRDLGVSQDHQTDDEFPDVSPRSPFLRDRSRKKVTLEWKEKWAIIHEGVFSLCKGRHQRSISSSIILHARHTRQHPIRIPFPLLSTHTLIAHS